MIPSEKTSPGRRKFFGALGLGAAAFVAAAKNPFSFLSTAKSVGGSADTASGVTITPNPMAVQRTKKGAAHHG
jgi:hypothetical protein